MYQILFILLVLATNCQLQADIGVSFPVTEKPKIRTEGLKSREDIFPRYADAVRIDGTVVYFTITFPFERRTQKHKKFAGLKKPQVKKPEEFDKLKEGMTLREIVSLLGPGSKNVYEGIGFITWRCDDGRVLKVWPTDRIDEKARYYVSLHGKNQRHEDVGRLAKRLIARLDITEQKVAVILTEDTYQAKAGEVKTYEVGQTFQKVDPLPRIDFTIAKIEGKSVYCYYFYQAAPQGLLHYSETGTLILHNREQDGAGQPSTRSESSSGGGNKPQPESEPRPQ